MISIQKMKRIFAVVIFFITFSPLCAMEDERKDAPEWAWASEPAIDNLANLGFCVEFDREIARIEQVVSDSTSLESACQDADAQLESVHDDGPMTRDQMLMEYGKKIGQCLQSNQKDFARTCMQIQLAEHLLDKGLDPNTPWFWLTLLDVALARISTRRARNIDSSDYERLVKKLVSLNAALPEKPVVLGFSQEDFQKVLYYFESELRTTIKRNREMIDPRNSSSICLEEHFYPWSTRGFLPNLKWIMQQCPPRLGEDWSPQKASDRILRSYLAPNPLPKQLAELVLDYYGNIVDASYGADRDNAVEQGDDGGEPDAQAPRSVCEQ